jgi:hypothetical protein
MRLRFPYDHSTVQLIVYLGVSFLVLGSLLPTRVCWGAVPDCSRIVTPEERERNNWISFQDARVLSISLPGKVLVVELYGKKYAIRFTDTTEVCNGGKPGTLRDLKVGDRIGGFTKIVQGRTVADIIGFGTSPNPSGIPEPNRPGWVRSPYAPSRPPIDLRGVPPGGTVECPYTGKLFLNPTSSKM